MGRPAKPASEQRVSVPLRVPRALRDEFAAVAEASGLTVAQGIERAMSRVVAGSSSAQTTRGGAERGQVSPANRPTPTMNTTPPKPPPPFRVRDVEPRFKGKG